MKQLIRLTTLFCSCAALALTVVAGPEPMSSGKEMKQVAPAPVPECNWTGFYIGVNVGGEWGHSEDSDFEWNFGVPNGFDGPKPWGYDQSGVIAGGQVGYNFQWNWLVLGIEGDFGYMDVDGCGTEPGSPGGDTFGCTNSDFYTTIRGRIGFAWGHWLFYGTGGGIGLNLEKSATDNCDTGACGGGLMHGSQEDFQWGYAAGGGIEYMIGCHWTIRAEYLRFEIDRDDFHTTDTGGVHYKFDGDTEGNIVRAALNYKF
jgi:outer membrane immunogenic protein